LKLEIIVTTAACTVLAGEINYQKIAW